MLHRLTHLNEQGKVHDRVKPLTHHRIQHRTVAEITMHKVATQYGVAVTARKVVQRGHAGALLAQQLTICEPM